ncbi:nuclear transport factor 2 family protein [Hyphomonas sp.]|uniref:nuclear transport factor 2 family protein n=1 Tax=Hyphomonas sp. TaxID=87 RepID=UPI003528CD52
MSVDNDISGVVEAYCRGMHEGSETLLRSVFHPGASIIGTFSNFSISSGLDQFVGGLCAGPSPASEGFELEFEILETRVDYPLASVVVTDALRDMRFTDHLVLIHLDGRWQIAGKAFATEAALPASARG